MQVQDQKKLRSALHAYVSEEAFDGWHRFSADHGVSVSGVIEAIGLAFAASATNVAVDDLVQSSRRVDADRRRRNRKAS